MMHGEAAYPVYMYPGLIELTLILFCPSSQAMLRAIWSTAALEVLYARLGTCCATP